MATILIVDDHVLSRQFLLALLDFGQHRLLEATDGLHRLKIARAEPPDLIITDIIMPNMDGYQFIMALRNDRALAAVPVIFYTATYSMAQTGVLTLACGVHQMLHKPATPDAIVDAVNVALARSAAHLGGNGRQLTTFVHALGVSSSEIVEFTERGTPTTENADLEKMTRRLSQSLADFQSIGLRLTALVDLGLKLADERDPQRLLESGCKIARHVGTARFAVLGIPDSIGDTYLHFTTHGLVPHQQAVLASAGPPHDLLRSVLNKRRPQRRHALSGNLAGIHLAPGHPVIDSILVLPIASSSHTYGWLYLADKQGAQRFSEIDEEVLMAVAAQIGVAYENLMLYERLRLSLAQLEREEETRARMTDELRESERRYSDMLANVELLSLMLDGEGRIRYCNDYLLHLTGWERADVLGRDWCALFLPADSHAGQHASYAALLDGAPHALHHKNAILTRTGQQRLVHWNNTVLRSQNGDIIGTASIGEDITEPARLRAMLIEQEAALREREAGLQRAQLMSRLAHVISGPDGTFESWSQTLPALLGMDAAIMPNSLRAWMGIVHPSEQALFRTGCMVRGTSTTHSEMVYRVRRGDAHWSVLRHVFEPLTDPLAVAPQSRWFHTIQDVTEQREQQQKLTRLSRSHAIKSGINAAIVRIGQHTTLLQEAARVAVAHGGFNMAWVGFVATNVQPGEDATIIWLGAAPVPTAQEQDRVGYIADLAARQLRSVVCNDIAAELGEAAATLCARGHHACAALPLTVAGTAVAVMLLFAGERDFFVQEEHALLDELAVELSFGLEYIDKGERLNFLARNDALTGLPNRLNFHERLALLVDGRNTGSLLCVVVIDLDRFSQLNDAHGRELGDAVLCMVAGRLGAAIGINATLARLGSDHFAVVLTALARGVDAAALIERSILDLIEPVFYHGKHALRMTARAGLALYPDDGSDAETLLKHAELALKKAKVANVRAMYYAPQMNAALAARLSLEGALRVALEEGQFSLHYQPRVDLDSGRIVSAEALIRWHHPQRGWVPPVQFIPLCEETGLILPIGDWVIAEVCAQQAAWRAAGLIIVPVAVNLSALQLKKGQLLRTIGEALGRHGLQQHDLEFELTESMMMDDPEQAIVFLQSLKALGAVLSLDDFGTGYSSLAYLQRFPFDFVKIDRSFVSNLGSNPGDAAIVNAVIAMAHSLQLHVVAEGVETADQLHYLRAQGCDQLQGYYFSPPVPPDAFAAMLGGDKRLVLAAR